MMKLISVQLLVAWLFGTLNYVSAADWSYVGNTGPSYWKVMAGNAACGGQKQSPINIDKSQVVTNESLGAIVFTGYDTKPQSMLLYNNGHSAQLNVQGNVKISGGGMVGDYILSQFHFHWGSTDSVGSEHTLDSRRYPMEIHLVHYSSQYSTATEAVDQTDGIAVLSFMFEVSEKDNPALDELVSGLKRISYEDSSVQLETFSMDSFLPGDRDHFYRYEGSLTTPHCQQNVVWTIFTSKLHISEAQLGEFRKLYTNVAGSTQNQRHLQDNFRPLQALNGRTVYTNSSNKISHCPVIYQLITALFLLIHRIM